MGVRSDKKKMLDAGCLDARSDERHRSAGRRTTEIETDDGDALATRSEYEGAARSGSRTPRLGVSLRAA